MPLLVVSETKVRLNAKGEIKNELKVD